VSLSLLALAGCVLSPPRVCLGTDFPAKTRHGKPQTRDISCHKWRGLGRRYPKTRLGEIPLHQEAHELVESGNLLPI
jgi:hypothetical protein